MVSRLCGTEVPDILNKRSSLRRSSFARIVWSGFAGTGNVLLMKVVPVRISHESFAHKVGIGAGERKAYTKSKSEKDTFHML